MAKGTSVSSDESGLLSLNKADPAVMTSEAFDRYKPVFSELATGTNPTIFTDQMILGNAGFTSSSNTCDPDPKVFFGNVPTKGTCRNVIGEERSAEYSASCGAQIHAVGAGMVISTDVATGRIEAATVSFFGNRNIIYYGISGIKSRKGDMIDANTVIGTADRLNDGACGVGIKW
jgi:hypothetical protein